MTITDWIPVSERLPEFPPGEPGWNNSEICVLCAFPRGGVREMRWTRNWAAKRERDRAPRWEETHNRLTRTQPTHWMPMPEPPQ